MVGLLNGSTGTAGAQRNSWDDRNLRLLIRFLLRPGSNCLDVGASRGKFLQDMAQVATRGRHIAYEPVPDLALDLRRRFPLVEIRQRALSNEDASTTFVHVLDPGMQGYSRLAPFVDGNIPRGLHTEVLTVRTERLDGHLPDGWLPEFVKIDVEGAEMLVLEGALDTLRRAKPVVAFEHGWHPELSPELYDLITSAVGLRLFDADGNGPLDRPRFLDELSTRWNWIAHE